MENFLNVAWLLIAIAFTAVWYVRWLPLIRQSGRETAVQQSLHALTLVLLLLFPVISLTDDLHADLLVVMPETKSSRISAHGNTTQPAAHVSHHGSPAADGVAKALECGNSLLLLGILSPPNLSSPDAQLRVPAEGRAPPVRA